MRTLLCLILLLAAQSARAELFEMSGTLTCGDPAAGGKLTLAKLSMPEIVAAAIDGSTDDAKQYALVYDSDSLRLIVARRCDGSEYMQFAVNTNNRGTNGAPKNGKNPYAVTQILSVTDWDGSVEQGRITCNYSGTQDSNSGDILTAKGKCDGALSLFDGEYSYCSLKSKIGKVLKVRNDCPV